MQKKKTVKVHVAILKTKRFEHDQHNDIYSVEFRSTDK